MSMGKWESSADAVGRAMLVQSSAVVFFLRRFGDLIAAKLSLKPKGSIGTALFTTLVAAHWGVNV